MADHKRKKKKRGRTKLFTSCFRSSPADERPFLTDNPDRRSPRNERLGKPVFIAASGGVKDDVISDVISASADLSGTGNVSDCDNERSFYGRSVSRFFKSVLFDSVTVKKTCSSSKPSIASDTTAFSSTHKTGKESDDSNGCGMESTDADDSSTCYSNLLSSSSRATSSSYTSSSSSSTNSNSRWLSEPKTSTDNHKPDPITSTFQPGSVALTLANPSSLLRSSSDHKLDSIDTKNVVSSVSSNPDKIKFSSNSWNIRWSLFLVLSLIVLVVYGRIYAILCTSMWFYLVPCRRVKRVNSVANSGVDTESEQYKKRVIMAGLLDRTRNPLR